AGRLNTWGQMAFWQSQDGRADNDPNYTECHFRFAGQYEDRETGLYYNRFRYYDKDSGQSISPDPIGLVSGLNPYGCVHCPTKYIDPLGLMCCPLITKGTYVTSDIIQGALEGDTMQTAQGSVSLPAIQRYVDRLLKGDVAPPIKVDGNIIVESNHRYVAGKIVGKIPETKVDTFDWGNY
ncbi:TPA: RHS repeat-associated core domain-containing protein, partial [Pseudomonas aeruginosa]